MDEKSWWSVNVFGSGWRRKRGQGVCLVVAHSHMTIGNFSGLLGGITMVAHRVSGNNINNIMVVREFIIFCVIKHHSSSPITIGNLIW